MNFLKDSESIENLYDFNKNSDQFKEYEKYLSYYYQAPSKKDIYGRELIDGNIILYDLKKTNKKIIIRPSKSVQLFYLLKNLELQKNIILQKISIIIEKPDNLTEEDKKEFDELKTKYAIYIKKIKEIDDFDEKHEKIKEDLIFKLINHSQQMAKYYIERHTLFNEIEEPVSKLNKNEIIKAFNSQGNKIPDQVFINKLSKQLNVPSIQTEKWLYWIEKCYQYLIAKKEYNKTLKEFNEYENDYVYKTNYFMIQKPLIEKKD